MRWKKDVVKLILCVKEGTQNDANPEFDPLGVDLESTLAIIDKLSRGLNPVCSFLSLETLYLELVGFATGATTTSRTSTSSF
jgi:hypothetical protein